MSKGSNSSGLRRYNERVLITLLRQLGSASKLELARLSNLTPQAVTRIIDDLDGAGMVIQKGKVQRGLGQPSTLYTLNPAGAFSIGVNVGRNNMQLLLMDFSGVVIEKIAHEFELPRPDFLLEKIAQGIRNLQGLLSKKNQKRLVGVGLAMPWFMDAWQTELAMSNTLAEQWATIKFNEEVGRLTHLPVFIENDCSSAAVAELQFGYGREVKNFLYIFIGTFVGGGIILNGNLESGAHGNAGAIASMPVPPSRLSSFSSSGQPFETMVNRASLYVLLRHLNAKGVAIKSISELPALLPDAQTCVDEWIADCADALSFGIFSAIGILDFDAVVIDANLPRDIVETLVASLRQKLTVIPSKGVLVPDVFLGKVGEYARAIGGALLPFYVNFSPDTKVMLTVSTV